VSAGIVHGGFIAKPKGVQTMTCTVSKPREHPAVEAPRPFWIVDVLFTAWHTMRNRREALQLLELSDHQLADIGLTRDDVNCALSSSLLSDPTRELARFSGR
jgi:uncharacterized protein YjiS (DUF1127 family)